MNPIRKQRLFALIAILIGSLLATWLITSALSENMNLFYSPTEIKVANLDDEILVRAGGMVKEGSIIRDTDSLNVTFTVTDYQNELIIKYEGILPDLFDENAGVVVRGNLNTDGTFTAIEVLAKHDENYMPPEIAEMLIEEKMIPELGHISLITHLILSLFAGTLPLAAILGRQSFLLHIERFFNIIFFDNSLILVFSVFIFN